MGPSGLEEYASDDTATSQVLCLSTIFPFANDRRKQFMKSLLTRIETVHILEVLWLSAILAIPTFGVSQYFIVSESNTAYVQVPKVALLRIIAAAMLIIYLYQIRNVHIKWDQCWNLNYWSEKLRCSSELMILISVSLVAVSTLITTILSTNVTVSILGLFPGQAGYSFYNTICYLIVFLAIITNLKSHDQLRRLLLSIVITGILISAVGFFQHFDVDIFRLLPTSNHERAALTTGNPVTAGSLLLLTIMVTLVSSSIHLYITSVNQGFDKTFIIKITIWSLILFLQFSALLFTLSRGPSIATLSSILLLVLSLIIFHQFRVVLITITVVVIASILSISVNSIQITYQDIESGQLVEVEPAGLDERISDIKTQIVTGSLNQRTSLWKSSVELIRNRPWFQSMELPFPSIRTFIGYGPDTFRYTFNLTSGPSEINGLPLEANHAHNYFIHQTVTEGIPGLLSSVALLLSPILMSGWILISKKYTSTLHISCLAGIFALFSGRFAEQLIGLATVSDLVIFWSCLAASVAAIKMFPRNTISETQEGRNTTTSDKPTFNQSTRVFILVLATLGILLFTVEYAIKYPISGFFAGQSRSLYQAGQLDESLLNIEKAISITPDVSYYYFFKSIVLKEFIDHPKNNIHYSCNKQSNHRTDNEGYVLCLAQELYSTTNTGKQIQPFWYPSTYQFAIVAKSFGQNEEALQAYEHMASLLPTNRTMLHMLSEEYIARGMFENAQNTLQQSLRISESNPNSANNDIFINEAITLLNEVN